MVLQAPLAAQMLGDYGADVIKIERAPRGDIMRDLDEVGSGRGEMSCYHAAVGRNKRTLCLDIKSPSGQEVLRELIRGADVLIHNFRPGVMERLGFSYDEVRELNPRLVYGASYAFGSTGPYAGFPGQDMLAQSLSGFAFNGVDPGEPPRLTSTPVVDYASAASLAQGILAALYGRERTGKGDLVTTSLFDVALAMQLLEISSRSLYDYKTEWLKYSFIFPTKDGWLTILTLFRDNPLKQLCEAFEVDDMSREPDLADASLQRENAEKVYERFGDVMKRYTTDECVERLGRTDILFAPALDLDEAMQHPQTEENGVLWEIPVPGHGTVKLGGNPVRLNGAPPDVTIPPSGLGEMSDEVLEAFGYNQGEIDALRERGVIR